MSLKSMHTRFGRLEKFNGDADKFPLFIKKFRALVFGLGKDYRLVLQERKPFKNVFYTTTDELSDEEYDEDELEAREEEKLIIDQEEVARIKVTSPDLKGIDMTNPEALAKVMKAIQEEANEKLRAEQERLKEPAADDADGVPPLWAEEELQQRELDRSSG